MRLQVLEVSRNCLAVRRQKGLAVLVAREVGDLLWFNTFASSRPDDAVVGFAIAELKRVGDGIVVVPDVTLAARVSDFDAHGLKIAGGL